MERIEEVLNRVGDEKHPENAVTEMARKNGGSWLIFV